MPIEEAMDYVAVIKPGSATETGFKYKVPMEVLEQGTVDAIVQYGANEVNVPQAQKAVHSRLESEISEGYGAQIGNTVYRHPDHARGDDRRHLITHKVVGRFKKTNILDEIEVSKEQIRNCQNMDLERIEEQIGLLDAKKDELQQSGAVVDYMQLEMVVAQKLRGGYR
jgi:hypothetical protein